MWTPDSYAKVFSNVVSILLSYLLQESDSTVPFTPQSQIFSLKKKVSFRNCVNPISILCCSVYILSSFTKLNFWFVPPQSQNGRVGPCVLFRLVRSVPFRSLKGMFHSFPFFFFEFLATYETEKNVPFFSVLF